MLSNKEGAIKVVDWLETHSRTLLIASGALFGVALIAWWLFFYEARVTFNVTPVSAAITVDGESIQPGTTATLRPGDHQVRIELTDYIPFEGSIGVRSGQYRTFALELRTTPNLRRLSSESAAFPRLSAEGDRLRYLNRAKGQVDELDLPENEADSIAPPRRITDAGAFEAVDEVVWAPQPGLALTRRGTAWSLFEFERFDLVHQRSTAWPGGVGAVSWHPTDSSRLLHSYAPGDGLPTGQAGEQTLVETDPLHAQLNRLTNLRASGVESPNLTWVGDGSEAILRSKQGQLWRFTLHSRTLAPITQSDQVAEFLPSPDGRQVLLRTNQGELAVIGVDGTNRRVVPVRTTLERAAWSADSTQLWFVEGDQSLSVRQFIVADGRTASFTMAPNQNVGQLNQVLVNRSGRYLVVTGSEGVALIRLEPAEYQVVPLT